MRDQAKRWASIRARRKKGIPHQPWSLYAGGIAERSRQNYEIIHAAGSRRNAIHNACIGTEPR